MQGHPDPDLDWSRCDTRSSRDGGGVTVERGLEGEECRAPQRSRDGTSVRMKHRVTWFLWEWSDLGFDVGKDFEERGEVTDGGSSREMNHGVKRCGSPCGPRGWGEVDVSMNERS